MQKMLGEPIDSFSQRRERNRDRKPKSAESRKRGLRVFSGIVRLVRYRVREKGADSEERRCEPSIGKVSRITRKRDTQSGDDGQQSGLARNPDVNHRDHTEVTLHHQEHAYGPRLYRLVSAKRQPELMPLVQQTFQIHCYGGHGAFFAPILHSTALPLSVMVAFPAKIGTPSVNPGDRGPCGLDGGHLRR